MQSYVFSTVDQVYVHWKSNHSNDNGDVYASTQKPFRFYLINLLSCNVDTCRYYSPIQRLQNHHKNKHPYDLFVPILNGRCAMCSSTGDGDNNGLNEHSCPFLQNGMRLKLINPVLLTDEELNELKTIGCQYSQPNGHQRIECQQCGSVFVTRQEMREHHFEQHKYDMFKCNLMFLTFCS